MKAHQTDHGQNETVQKNQRARVSNVHLLSISLTSPSGVRLPTRAGPLLIVALASTLAACARPTPGTTTTSAPGHHDVNDCARDPSMESRFGASVPDPFRWLEKGDSPSVRTWWERADASARTYLDGLSRRPSLHNRLAALQSSGEVGLPVRRGAALYYMRRDSGKDKSSLFRRDANGETLLIDPTTWPGASHEALSGFSVSNDGTHIVYGAAANNGSVRTLHVLDVNSGHISDLDVIPGVQDSIPSWDAAGKGFYYRWSPPRSPRIPAPDQPGYAEVRFHRLGQSPDTDEIIRHATGDARVTEYPLATRDGHWLVLFVEHGFSRQDVFLRDLRNSDSRWLPLATGENAWNELYEVDDVFFLRTTSGASHGRVFRISSQNIERSSWIEVVAEKTDAVLSDMTLVKGGMLLRWQKDAISSLELRDRFGRSPRSVALPSMGVVEAISGAASDDDAYVLYESYAIPNEVLRVDWNSATAALFQRVTAPIDSSAYVVEQTFYTSRDGTRAPILLAHRRDLHPTGAVPTLLHGYGGFGDSIAPYFTPRVVAWLDEGGLYADAVVRGGGEYGEEWHRAGMKKTKQNSFDDFAAAGRELTRLGWTRPDHLVARGSSNGGLLVATAITQHPELFGAAIIGAPLTDMIRFPLFGNGKQWTEEYGSPDDPEEFRVLLSYSPYQHVKSGVAYPAVLAQIDENDDLVDGLHARKFVQALRCSGTSSRTLLTVERHGGHEGSDSIAASVDRDADALAFALSEIAAHD